MQFLVAGGVSESFHVFCRAAATLRFCGCCCTKHINTVTKLVLAALQVLERRGLTHVPSAFCLKDVFQVGHWSHRAKGQSNTVHLTTRLPPEATTQHTECSSLQCPDMSVFSMTLFRSKQHKQ